MGRVKSRMKRFAAVVLSLAVMVPVGVFGTSQTAKADGPTGAGLAAHAMTRTMRAGPTDGGLLRFDLLIMESAESVQI